MENDTFRAKHKTTRASRAPSGRRRRRQHAAQGSVCGRLRAPLAAALPSRVIALLRGGSQNIRERQLAARCATKRRCASWRQQPAARVARAIIASRRRAETAGALPPRRALAGIKAVRRYVWLLVTPAGALSARRQNRCR